MRLFPDDGRPDEALERRDNLTHLIAIMPKCLPPKYERILRMRHGLGGRVPMTQREIALLWGISTAMVQVYEMLAHRKLRRWLEREQNHYASLEMARDLLLACRQCKAEPPKAKRRRKAPTVAPPASKRRQRLELPPPPGRTRFPPDYTYFYHQEPPPGAYVMGNCWWESEPERVSEEELERLRRAR